MVTVPKACKTEQRINVQKVKQINGFALIALGPHLKLLLAAN